MNLGKTIFAQLIEFLPARYEFNKCVERYADKRDARSFSFWDHFLCMSFAQLTYRESLRDIEVCLRAQGKKLYHMGIRGSVSRSTLAHANANRDWRIFADYARVLIAYAQELHKAEKPSLLEQVSSAVYALDATIIQVCLSLFPWAPYNRAQGGIKMHTQLDLKSKIPTFIAITSGKTYELSVLDALQLEPGAFYVMDRGYLDYGRLFRLDQAKSFYVIRAKRDISYRRVYSRAVDKDTGLRVDQTIRLTNDRAKKAYPSFLRLVRFCDPTTKKHFLFLTNNFDLSALTIATMYRSRWDIELFFRWVKQHLRIKSFFGLTENAVHVQLWSAICTYVLVIIARKKLGLTNLSLYTVLQILSISIVDKKPILQAFDDLSDFSYECESDKQLNLWDIHIGQ
jgi:hypothetical protein